MVIVRKENSYQGFVTVGERIYIYIIDISDCSENQGSVSVDWRLKLLLGPSLDNFLEDNTFSDPYEFDTEFSKFVNEKVGDRIKCEAWVQNPLKMCTIIKNLKSDIENSGEYISHLDFENGIVEIKVQDSQLRDHKATLKLSSNYPKEPIEVISYDLPCQGTTSSDDFNNIYLVSEFCKKFSYLVNSFQEFWNTVAVLDSQCCVLDPPNPTFRDVSRRIKLADTLSLVLTFNPFVANQRPNIQLLGCQSDVNQYNMILQKNLENEMWDNEEDLLYNLSNILELEIPSKMNHSEAKEGDDLMNEAGECAICFTWRLNNEIPNEVCEKETCKSMYHSECLFTYLSSVLKNKDYFGKIQGECPNCDEVISCAVPKFK